MNENEFKSKLIHTYINETTNSAQIYRLYFTKKQIDKIMQIMSEYMKNNEEKIDLLYHLIVELWYDVADDHMKKCGHPGVAGVDGDVAEFSASKGKIDGMIESLKQIRNMI